MDGVQPLAGQKDWLLSLEEVTDVSSCRPPLPSATLDTTLDRAKLPSKVKDVLGSILWKKLPVGCCVEGM